MDIAAVPQRLRLPILVITLAATAAFALAVLLCPIPGAIAVPVIGDGVWLGVAFWVAVALIASALPVRVSGIYVDLSTAPVIAVMNLGGPAAVAIVALFGTISPRELRREIPWYGFLGNRSMLVLEAVAASAIVAVAPGRSVPFFDLVATSAAGLAFFVINIVLAAWVVSIRSEEPARRLLRQGLGAFVAMLALAPLAWLMARIYLSAGWWAVLLFAVPLSTTRMAYQKFVEIREMFVETARSLAAAVDSREPFTSHHSHNVQDIAMDIGREMRLTEEELEALEWGGLLHDIGKIGIPDAVLLKQERLTREERETMNMHPKLGADIIAPVRRLAPELPIILHHHEWFNGSGYPGRLVGDEIPKLARILHVADAYEAMIAQRPYRMIPLTPEQALGELRKFGGIQFDPEVVDAFAHTKWVAEVPDPGRPSPREIAFLADAALGGGETAPAPA